MPPWTRSPFRQRLRPTARNSSVPLCLCSHVPGDRKSPGASVPPLPCLNDGLPEAGDNGIPYASVSPRHRHAEME